MTPSAKAVSRNARHRKATRADKLVRFVTQLTILAVWKCFSAVSAPVARVFSFYIWCAQTSFKFGVATQRLVCKLLGWLDTPAVRRTHQLRRAARYYFSLDLKKWHVGIALLFTMHLMASVVRKLRENFDKRLKQRKELLQRMQTAQCYSEWKSAAKQLDQVEGHDPAKAQTRWKNETRLYDRKLVQEKMMHLIRMRAGGNVREMMLALRSDLIRNVGNIANSQLHDHFLVVPEPIVKYIEEVKTILNLVADSSELGLSVEEKLSFFRETRHAFGRTALLLSGGGGLGSFHIGVVKALFEHRLLPRVLAGSSVGSIVSAIVATRTDEELRDIFSHLDTFDVGFFNNNKAVEFVQHFFTKGTLQDIDFLIKKLRALIGDVTFLEAYERSGRILNVTVCPADTNEPPRLLNYLTAPHALVWSAVAASSAFPGLFPAQQLMARSSKGEYIRFSSQATSDSLERRWRDGSLEVDLPVDNLKEMFNCNYFLVSQCNPHIVPLLRMRNQLTHKWGNILESELKHRCQQLQWLLPDWLPSKWLTLFTQPWEGDITMVLPVSVWDLGKAIVNPTTEELMRAVKYGEVATWQKLPAMECNCSIEATLDQCLAKVTNSLRGHTRGFGNRIPSWLHMPSLGVPGIPSWGSMQDLGEAHASWGTTPVGSETVVDYPPVPEETIDDLSMSRSSMDEPSSCATSAVKLQRHPVMSKQVGQQLDCCDNTANIWKELFLPLASSSMALSEPTSSGLDAIAC